MPSRISIETLDSLRPDLRALIADRARTLPDLRYCDLRIEVREEKGAGAENGDAKAGGEDYSFDFGVRAISGAGTGAAGYYERVLEQSDADNIEAVVWEGLEQAHQRARASVTQKERMRQRHPLPAGSLGNSELAPGPPSVDTVAAAYDSDPRTVPLDAVIQMAVDGCRALQDVDGQVAYCAASASTQLMRELFISSDGADIDQTFAQTEGFAIVVCSGEHGNFELYDFTGHQRGWEILTEGYDNGLPDSASIRLPNFVDFCGRLSADAREAAAAPPLKPPARDVVVVTNPHFNTLLVHEVVGHPSELDRALKYETGYVGRSWFLKDLNDHQLGQQIASPLVSAFSTPLMEGYGSFRYDPECTPARRAYIIRDSE